MLHKLKDETGEKHNHWTVINRALSDSSGRATWNCVCDCGTHRIIDGVRLRTGKTKSCGCVRGIHPRKLTKEQIEERATSPRQCTMCLEILPPEAFYSDKPTWHWCKKCRSAWAKRHRKKTPFWWILKKYKLTRDEYLMMLERQDGACPICLTQHTDSRPLHVDHDHRLHSKDKRSHRALVCGKCNPALGSLGENPDNFRRAIEYLEFHKKRLDKLLNID